MAGTSHLSNRRPKWRSEAVLDAYNLVIAGCVFVSPWLFTYTRPAGKIDIWFSSAAIALTAIAAMLAYANWKEWLNLLLGVWLIASPWLLGFPHTRAMHVCIGTGGVVAFIAVTELLVVNLQPMDRPPTA